MHSMQAQAVLEVAYQRLIGAVVLDLLQPFLEAFCHGFWSLRMAFRMVRSFLAHAMRATILGFPASRRRWWNALIVGLNLDATMTAMKSAARTGALPAAIMLLPFH